MSKAIPPSCKNIDVFLTLLRYLSNEEAETFGLQEAIEASGHWASSLLTKVSASTTPSLNIFLELHSDLRRLICHPGDWRWSSPRVLLDVGTTMSCVLPSVPSGLYEIHIQSSLHETAVSRKYFSFETSLRKWLNTAFRRRSLKVWDRLESSRQSQIIPEILSVNLGQFATVTFRIHRPVAACSGDFSQVPRCVSLVAVPAPSFPPPSIERCVYLAPSCIAYDKDCTSSHVTLTSQLPRMQGLAVTRVHSLNLVALIRNVDPGTYSIGLRFAMPYQNHEMTLSWSAVPGKADWATLSGQTKSPSRPLSALWFILCCSHQCKQRMDIDRPILKCLLPLHMHFLCSTSNDFDNGYFSSSDSPEIRSPLVHLDKHSTIIVKLTIRQMAHLESPCVFECVSLQPHRRADRMNSTAEPKVKGRTDVLMPLAIHRRIVVHSSRLEQLAHLNLGIRKRYSNQRFQIELLESALTSTHPLGQQEFLRRRIKVEKLARFAQDVTGRTHFHSLISHSHAAVGLRFRSSCTPLDFTFCLRPHHYQVVCIMDDLSAPADVDGAVFLRNLLVRIPILKWEATLLTEDACEEKCQRWCSIDTLTLTRPHCVDVQLDSIYGVQFERLEFIESDMPVIEMQKMRLYEPWTRSGWMRQVQQGMKRHWALSPDFVCPYMRYGRDIKKTSLCGIVDHSHHHSKPRALRLVLLDVRPGLYKGFVVLPIATDSEGRSRHGWDNLSLEISVLARSSRQRSFIRCLAHGSECCEKQISLAYDPRHSRKLYALISQQVDIISSASCTEGWQKLMSKKPIYVPDRSGSIDVHVVVRLGGGRDNIDVFGLEPFLTRPAQGNEIPLTPF
eukprot:Blabericola_migrator_1__4228@NODE_2299_length_2984_cov_10_715118_g1441_i0_p1_GENE_NODE_2299_length_2984_cov_10_715118_g1441_i0NODE_2299_length_2984_cov_10_715118_g1441_i0_p1_ORF_typecomplete_len842_score68_30_NODE_2299_length_2984_cov_10_715118_g1441_i03882913